ncbi:ParB/RepB/Spo0J family partition protein [Mycobacteroides abscessus]|uniref:ParB/RepB/Spo0J family partition protein n=1 Tax=Mycobacteroides abscessus TaxID=36809 RepID=UPI000C2561DD|nr:ParB/RepB/Spo0J family partition protein [Mycobacteroides abscessus]
MATSMAAKKPRRPGGSTSGERRSSTRVQAAGPAVDADPQPGSGRFASLAADDLSVDQARGEGRKVLDLSPKLLIPHPVNDPDRSIPDPDDADGLVGSVKARGVRMVMAAATRAAFEERFPGLLPTDADGEYVLLYGHRRRAAALAAGVATVPVIVNDAELDQPDRGLMDMYVENKHHEKLAPVAEAHLLNRFIEDMNLSQQELAKMLGASQPTISRRLSLLLLAEPLRKEVVVKKASGDEEEFAEKKQADTNKLNPTEASTLAATLPYGPVYSWQKSPDKDQDSPERLEEQLRAFELIKQGSLVSTAVARAKAERKSRAAAAAQGWEIIDPVAYFGDASTALKHRYYEDPTGLSTIVVAIDEHGSLAHYNTSASMEIDPATLDDHDDELDENENAIHDDDESVAPAEGSTPSEKTPSPAGKKKKSDTDEDKKPRPAPKAPAAEKKATDDSKARIEASKKRSEAAQTLILKVPAKDQLGQILIDQYACGAIAQAATAWALERAEEWGYVPAENLESPTARAAHAWALALAGYELAAVDSTKWGKPQQSYIALLRDRAKYEPTPWEQKQLDQVN